MYKAVTKAIEEAYLRNSGKTIEEVLGDVSFENISLVVIADNEEESLNVRKGITDVNMWELVRTED